MNKFIIVDRNLSFLKREWKTSEGASTRATFPIKPCFSRQNNSLDIAPFLTCIFSDIPFSSLRYLTLFYYHFQVILGKTRKESGTEIGNSLEFDFVVPPPHS